MQSLLNRKRSSSAVPDEVPVPSAVGCGARHAGSIAARVRYALIVLCLVASPLVLQGQQTFRNLTGSVTDGDHEPLKGVVVQVENSATMTVISYITGRSGTYSFKRLDGDTNYKVWATFRGKRSKVRQLSGFDSNKPKIVNFVIKDR